MPSENPTLNLSPRKQILLSLAAVTMSLGVGVVLGEILIRLFVPQEMSGSLRYEDARNIGYSRPSTSVAHYWSGRKVQYRTNSYYQRGNEPPANVPRILALGDSFTFGWLLSEESTYLALLQKHTDETFGPGAFTWLNGGAGGWGAAHYLGYLEDQGDRIQPSLLVVFLNFRDISKSAESALYEIADHQTLRLNARSAPTSRTKSLLKSIPGYHIVLEHSQLAQWVRKWFTLRETRQDEQAHEPAAVAQKEMAGNRAPAATPELGLALFRRLHQWAEARHIPLVVLTTGFQWTPPAQTGAYTADLAFLAEAPAVLAKEGIPFCELPAARKSEILAHHGDFLLGEGHPNERGARWISDHAWDCLRPHLQSFKASRK